MFVKAMNTLETILYPVVDLMNGVSAETSGLLKHPETKLFGADAALDSVALLNFITATEEQITSVTGRKIVLVTPRALSARESPFRTLGSLAAYIDEHLRATSKDGGE
jgi:acyl carrier protein